MSKKKMVKDELTGQMVSAEVFKPIPAKYLKLAKPIARAYRIVIEPLEAEGFISYSLEMPGVLSEGKTIAECAEAEYYALELVVALMLKEKQSPPKPGSKERA